jgi:hypothetical protein
MAKFTLLYASQRPRTQMQPDVRSIYVQFYRPVLPAKGSVTIKLREVSVGRAWSTFRAELFQGDVAKVLVSGDIT